MSKILVVGLFTKLSMTMIVFSAAFHCSAVAQKLEEVPEWPKTMYACYYHGALERFDGSLQFAITYTEQKDIFSHFVKWSMPINSPYRKEGRSAPLLVKDMVGHHGERSDGWLSFEWPNNHPWRDRVSDEFTTSNVSVKITNSGLFGQKMQKKERWHQSVIVRDKEALIRQGEEDSFLILNGLEPALVTDFGHISSLSLWAPLASLLAWGAGLDELTIYDVFVEPTKYRSHAYSRDPVSHRRVVGMYKIDISAFSRAFAQMKTQHEGWLKSLSDFKNSCRKIRVDDPSTEIIVN